MGVPLDVDVEVRWRALAQSNASAPPPTQFPDEEPDLDWFNRPRNPSNPDPDGYDQSQTWKAPEIHLEDGRILVLEYT